jgi:hypothetical protein
MPDGNHIDIQYWSEGGTMCVAAFNDNGKQVSAGKYCFEAEGGDSYLTQMFETAMESHASTIENDLKTNPGIHYRP